ncbi:hypothetical protein acdb102_07380 [Acidothermaceae bacterium B102]|nr:hypothetical protein acdb102_07380 [Acidothermaceae bacterium B102]
MLAGAAVLALARGCAHPVTAASPSPWPSVSPSPATSTVSEPVCSAENLWTRQVGDGSFIGHAVPYYQLQNRGRAACSLRGYVAVRAYSTAGLVQRLNTEEVPATPEGAPIPVRTVILAPGAAAQFILSEWYGDACSRPPFGRVDVTLPGGGGLLTSPDLPRNGECAARSVDISPIYAAAYVQPLPE